MDKLERDADDTTRSLLIKFNKNLQAIDEGNCRFLQIREGKKVPCH
jgi:hypothetical protein